MVKMLLSLFLLTVSVFAQYTVQVTNDVVYGKGWVTNPSPGLTDLKMDAYIPDNPAVDKAAIVYAHGGGWKEGDKGSRVTEFTQLAAMGHCVFSINYRMLNDGLDCPSIGTSAPESSAVRAAIVDMKAAVRYVRANAAAYGISKDRVAVMGGSAGAYTAVVAALVENDTMVNDGPADPAIPHNNPSERSKPDLCAEMFGFVIDWLPNFRSDIDSTDPPMLIMHGNADEAIPFTGAYSFRTYCRNEGITWELHIIDGGIHGEWFDSTNIWVDNFIQANLFDAGIADGFYLPEPDKGLINSAGQDIFHINGSGARQNCRESGMYLVRDRATGRIAKRIFIQ